jgi:anti-anti-sigma factor
LVEGELDLAVADQLREALQRDTGQVLTLINLERCEFIDSTGIAVVLQAHRESVEEGRRVSICTPSPPVLRVLELTGLTDNGFVFDNSESAVSAATELSGGPSF